MNIYNAPKWGVTILTQNNEIKKALMDKESMNKILYKTLGDNFVPVNFIKKGEGAYVMRCEKKVALHLITNPKCFGFPNDEFVVRPKRCIVGLIIESDKKDMGKVFSLEAIAENLPKKLLERGKFQNEPYWKIKTQLIDRVGNIAKVNVLCYNPALWVAIREIYKEKVFNRELTYTGRNGFFLEDGDSQGSGLRDRVEVLEMGQQKLEKGQEGIEKRVKENKTKLEKIEGNFQTLLDNQLEKFRTIINEKNTKQDKEYKTIKDMLTNMNRRQ